MENAPERRKTPIFVPTRGAIAIHWLLCEDYHLMRFQASDDTPLRLANNSPLLLAWHMNRPWIARHECNGLVCWIRIPDGRLARRPSKSRQMSLARPEA